MQTIKPLAEATAPFGRIPTATKQKTLSPIQDCGHGAESMASGSPEKKGEHHAINNRAATTGDGANAATTGDGANAATTGDGANAAVGHKNAIAAALGIESATKGILGSWIVVAEWVKDGNRWTVKSVKAVQVDGKKVKADTFYMLKDGKLEEVK